MKVARHQREELQSLSKAELVEYTLELERQHFQDSTNSSKPPSKDGAQARDKRTKKKNKSLRKKSGLKPGGQPGHSGTTLQPKQQPDHQVDIKLDQCPHCQTGLNDTNLTGQQVDRQVFDLPPPPPLECTQYSSFEYQCAECGGLSRRDFPQAVRAPVQYGSRLMAWLAYMKDEMLLPCNRIETFFRDMLDAPISAATILQARENLYNNLEQWEKNLIEKLIEVEVLGADESGLRVNQNLQWLHVACTGELTHFAVHEKRGREAMDEIGILPEFSNRLIHDYFSSYNKYSCAHGLCNEHHLRDLAAVAEAGNQSWAGLMSEHLKSILHRRHELEEKGDTAASEQEIEKVEQQYKKILKIAEQENPLPPPQPKKKRGRRKKGKARNLFERFRDKREEILAFFKDFRVPFTNNQAERDIRMIKVQQKVSGCFRSDNGARRFARIRSYLSTMRKQDHNLFEAIKAAMEGSPNDIGPARGE